jgi:hypothetical protein
MPGQPKWRAFCAAVDEDAVMECVADGQTLKAIGFTYGVSRSMMYRWVGADPDRKARYAAAKRASAEVLVEEAVALLDGAEPDRDSITKAKAQAGIRQWLAERLDRAQYGEDKSQPVLQVNVGSLHLAALQAQPTPQALEGVEVTAVSEAGASPVRRIAPAREDA